MHWEFTESLALDEIKNRKMKSVNSGKLESVLTFWKEIKDIADELQPDIKRIKTDYVMTQEQFEKSFLNNGSHQGYLFKCLKCGKHRLHTDFD